MRLSFPAIAALALILTGCSSRPDAAGVTVAAMDCLISDDYAGYLEKCRLSSGLKEFMTDYFAEVIEPEISGRGGMVSFALTDTRQEEFSATVRGKAFFADASSRECVFHLTLVEDGTGRTGPGISRRRSAWKIEPSR